MTRASTPRHFRTNPIEILIFLAVAVIFGKSLYGLVYDEQSFMNIATTANSASALRSTLTPQAAQTDARAPASIPHSSFVSLDISCDKPIEQETGASKIRLSGSLCGFTGGMDHPNLIQATISNTANKFVATVFTDLSGGKFSTDYIPLNSGKNPIQVHFTYKDGKSVTQLVTINKN